MGAFSCSEQTGLGKTMTVESWYTPRITAVNPTGKVVTVRIGEATDLSLDVEPYQWLPDEQDWRRHPDPVLSTNRTEQDWCKVVCYAPFVLRADGLFKMWYVGSSETTRKVAKIDLGYATSRDGVHWEEYPGNPIATRVQVPLGKGF